MLIEIHKAESQIYWNLEFYLDLRRTSASPTVYVLQMFCI